MRGLRRGDWMPALGPAAIGVVFFALGRPLRALILIALSALVALLIVLGVDVAQGIARAAVAAGKALSLVGSHVIYVLLIIPAWAWSHLRGGTIADATREGGTWVERSTLQPAPRSLVGEVPGPGARLSVTGRALWSIGCVVAVLALNYGAGWLWDTTTGRSTPSSSAIRTTGTASPTTTTIPLQVAPTVSTPGDTGVPATSTTAPRPVPHDPRAESPAMAAYPWRDQYLDDIQRAPTVYWPFTEYRPLPFSSPYLNIDGWTRRTYRTPGPNTGRPVVWMLGGSTTWGEGQRDEYTIASWLARLAEADGTPIEIRNYGQRGWTHFQEMVLYEQRLALDAPPDISLFYDGVNETPTQSLVEEAVPSHFQVAEQREQRGERTISTRLTGPPPTTSNWSDDAVSAYAEHSLIHKVVRWFSPAADASTGQAPERDAEGTDEGEVRSPEYAASQGDGTDAGRVYERSKFLTLALSRREGVETLLYWQPAAILGFPEQQARLQLTPPTIDISEMLFDHRKVFLDNVHTNEEGARLVAERIWLDLHPLVETWYRDDG